MRSAGCAVPIAVLLMMAVMITRAWWLPTVALGVGYLAGNWLGRPR